VIKPMVVLCAAVTVLAAGGCAAAPDREEGLQVTPSASRPEDSRTPPPSQAPPPPPASAVPSAKVSPPSDLQPTGVVVGRIVRGGSGPCYGVETDDGKLYAVYSTKAGTLAVGTNVRIKTAPLLLKIYCGEGEHVSGVSVEVV
jgi:hypothetical protein